MTHQKDMQRLNLYYLYFHQCVYPSILNQLRLRFLRFRNPSITLPEKPDKKFISGILDFPPQLKKESLYNELLLIISTFLKTSPGLALKISFELNVGALDFGITARWASPNKNFIQERAHHSLWRSICERCNIPPFVRIPFIGIVRTYSTAHYAYPLDAGNHAQEATRIFFSTLFDRLKGTFYDFRSNFFRKKQSGADCYQPDFPISRGASVKVESYWIGHASCLLGIPVKQQHHKKKRLRILTDPVEGDLSKLFYKRRTKPARTIETLPSIDVVLISHDHRDHVDEATLRKLIPQQPLFIVPKGTKGFFQTLGFKKVVELLPGEKVDIKQGNRRLATIHGVKAKHWTGRLFNDAHSSAFLSYIIQSNGVEGDLYFAGDTALLDSNDVKELTENFDVRYSFQPGGPDENRRDMQSTHQSSADGLLMHMRFLGDKIRKCNQKGGGIKEKDLPKLVKTLYMHTKTFKLGNLHHDDTDLSVARILSALEAIRHYDEVAGKIVVTTYPGEYIFLANLEQSERFVLDEILKLIWEPSLRVLGESNRLIGLTPQSVAAIFRESVIIPKIGERTQLTERQPLSLLKHALIINQKALDECLSRETLPSLFKTYSNRPWHFKTREHTGTVKAFCEKIASYSPDELKNGLDELAALRQDKSGHLAAYVNYSALQLR